MKRNEFRLTDLTVQNAGSISLLRDHTAAGRDWLLDNVATDDNITFGDAIVVGQHYIADIIAGARADGLTVGGGAA
jgi:hypothetical protein